MNKFFDTAVGKSVKTGVWIIVAYAIPLVTARLVNYHYSASLMALGVPGIVNWALYTAKVFADRQVPNLPSSVPMKLVPASPGSFTVGTPTLTLNVPEKSAPTNNTPNVPGTP